MGSLFSFSDQVGIVLTAVLAALLGGVIGLERERAGKPADSRTQALVAAACATLVHVGVVVDHMAGSGDPTRALHGVITGVGFLGASTIFRSEKSATATGLTTAATVFTTAAIGITVGIGAPVSAAFITVVVLAILRWPQIRGRLFGHPVRTDDIED